MQLQLYQFTTAAKSPKLHSSYEKASASVPVFLLPLWANLGDLYDPKTLTGLDSCAASQTADALFLSCLTPRDVEGFRYGHLEAAHLRRAGEQMFHEAFRLGKNVSAISLGVLFRIPKAQATRAL
jgi:hypothetical protein